jgi:hypothetical protein
MGCSNKVITCILLLSVLREDIPALMNPGWDCEGGHSFTLQSLAARRSAEETEARISQADGQLAQEICAAGKVSLAWSGVVYGCFPLALRTQSC